MWHFRTVQTKAPWDNPLDAGNTKHMFSVLWNVLLKARCSVCHRHKKDHIKIHNVALGIKKCDRVPLNRT